MQDAQTVAIQAVANVDPATLSIEAQLYAALEVLWKLQAIAAAQAPQHSAKLTKAVKLVDSIAQEF
jgi:hypothetical protein